MYALHTDGIVLSRINYGESDRIITILSKDYGKINLIARGVRKEKSKLAGGIELFCISNLGFIESRGELAILVSSRLIDNLGCFISDIERVNFAFEALTKINKITERRTEASYFYFLKQLLGFLNDFDISLQLIELWWCVGLSKLTGHSINIIKPINDKSFQANKKYSFIISRGGFKSSRSGGDYTPEHIKLIKLALSHSPKTLARVKNGDSIALDIIPTIRSFVDYVY